MASDASHLPLESVTCELCGASDEIEVYKQTLETSGIGVAASYQCTNSGFGRHYRIVRCRRCQLVYANPRRPDSDTLDSYARVEDELYLAEQDGRYLTFAANLDRVEQVIGRYQRGVASKRILDLGCYVGVFLDVARARGWDTRGVELSRWASELARVRLGLDVFTGTLGEAGFDSDQFDLVTMWDVIEHLTHPMADLREAWRVLKPGGFICIHTIDIGSPFAWLMGHRWPWLMEMHLYFFTKRTLRLMLQRAGFEQIKSATHGRVLRLGYLLTKLEPYNHRLYRCLDATAGLAGLRTRPVQVDFGDLFTTFARKPGQSPGYLAPTDR